MGFVCVMPETMAGVDANYASAQRNYAVKKQEIMNRLKDQYNVSGEEFVKLIQEKLSANMKEKIVSPITGRSVGYETILKHLYDAVDAYAQSIIESHSAEISALVGNIKNIQSNAVQSGKQAQKEAGKMIDDAVQHYANEMQLNNIIYKYLPEFISGDNVKLSLDQIFGYAKSIFRQQITKQLTTGKITEVFKRHPAIILGYIREDATADASRQAAERLGMSSAKAQTVGAEQSKIDIIIPLSGGAASAISSGGDLLKAVLSNLDSMNQSFEVEGESSLETNEFLGIQSKPWKLFLPTTAWNRNSVGSRSALLQDFLQNYNPDGADNNYSWHSGVYYLSTQLEEVIGANTVMYVTGNSIVWTDEIFDQIRGNKYFAFMVDSNNKLTSHVQLADHYG